MKDSSQINWSQYATHKYADSDRIPDCLAAFSESDHTKAVEGLTCLVDVSVDPEEQLTEVATHVLPCVVSMLIGGGIVHSELAFQFLGEVAQERPENEFTSDVRRGLHDSLPTILLWTESERRSNEQEMVLQLFVTSANTEEEFRALMAILERGIQSPAAKQIALRAIGRVASRLASGSRMTMPPMAHVHLRSGLDSSDAILQLAATYSLVDLGDFSNSPFLGKMLLQTITLRESNVKLPWIGAGVVEFSERVSLLPTREERIDSLLKAVLLLSRPEEALEPLLALLLAMCMPEITYRRNLVPCAKDFSGTRPRFTYSSLSLPSIDKELRLIAEYSHVLQHLVDHDLIWAIDTNLWELFGLPKTRDELRKLVISARRV